jgi:hypothetical protein
VTGNEALGDVDGMKTLRGVLVGLIVAATVAFFIGVGIERANEDARSGSAETPHVETGGETGDEVGEEGEPTGSEGGATQEEGTILGIDPESIPLAIGAGVVSLLLAFLVWTRPAWRWPSAVTAVVMFGFLIFDIREILHQVEESRASVTIAATVVALLHGAAAVVAVVVLARRGPSEGGASARSIAA